MVTKYLSIHQASAAALALGITSKAQYQIRYKEDSKLPSNPNLEYSKAWEDFGKWKGFLGKSTEPFYNTIGEASQAAIKLGAKSSTDYITLYKKDPRLPAEPQRVYDNDWDETEGWYGFLGQLEKAPYKTIEEASVAAINLEIKSSYQYQNCYKLDSKLPSNPSRKFKEDWNSFGQWAGFLGRTEACHTNTE